MVWGIVNSTPRSIILPLEITLTGLKTYFRENMEFRDKKIENLLLSFPINTPSGNDGIALEFSKNKFITLSKNGLEFFQQVPLFVFYQLIVQYPLRLQNIQFDLQSSYIETLTTSEDDLKTVFFNAIIDDNPINTRR